MRLLSSCVLLAALVHPRPRQEERPSIAEEIDALIEKTNAYQRFRAVYELVKEDEEAPRITCELTFIAPDTAGVRVSGEFRASCFLVSNRYYVETEDERWKTFEIEYPEAKLLLDELLPSENPLEGGMSFGLDPRDGFQVSVVNLPSQRAGLLLWLQSMRRGLAKVTEEQDQLVWTGEAFRLAVSRASGFPEEMRLEIDGSPGVATLVELRLDEEVEGGLELPEEARSAVLDEAAGEQAQRNLLALLRTAAFLRLERRFEAGTVAWDSRTRGLREEFLEALHRDMLGRSMSAWAQGRRDWIDRVCAGLRERLDVQDTPEGRARLREDMAAVEEKLVETLSKGMEKYLEDLPAVGTDSTEPRDELFAVEREVVERMYAELVSQPVLDYLHEQVAAVLGKEER